MRASQCKQRENGAGAAGKYDFTFSALWNGGNGERKKKMMRLCICIMCQCMVLLVNSVEMMRDQLG